MLIWFRSSYNRLFIGFLLPPLLFALLAPNLLSMPGREQGSPWTHNEYFFVLIASYIYGAVPCLIYAVAMEYAVNPNVESHTLVIVISALLGAFATLSIVGLAGGVGVPWSGGVGVSGRDILASFAVAGAAIGVSVGTLLRLMFSIAVRSRRRTASAAIQRHPER